MKFADPVSIGAVVTGRVPFPLLYPTAVCETSAIRPGTAPALRTVEPYFEESKVDVAIIVAAPAEAGVNTPEASIAPLSGGLTDHRTDEV
jgi:hypothetical protein